MWERTPDHTQYMNKPIISHPVDKYNQCIHHRPLGLWLCPLGWSCVLASLEEAISCLYPSEGTKGIKGVAMLGCYLGVCACVRIGCLIMCAYVSVCAYVQVGIECLSKFACVRVCMCEHWVLEHACARVRTCMNTHTFKYMCICGMRD